MKRKQSGINITILLSEDYQKRGRNGATWQQFIKSFRYSISTAQTVLGLLQIAGILSSMKSEDHQ